MVTSARRVVVAGGGWRGKGCGGGQDEENEEGIRTKRGDDEGRTRLRPVADYSPGATGAYPESYVQKGSLFH